MRVAEAMLDAPSSQRHALSMTAKSLMECLEAEVTGDDSGFVAKRLTAKRGDEAEIDSKWRKNSPN